MYSSEQVRGMIREAAKITDRCICEGEGEDGDWCVCVGYGQKIRRMKT